LTYDQIRFERDRAAVTGFRSGVSLHSHTLHSEESLGFIYRLAIGVAPIRMALQHGEARYRAVHGGDLDLRRAWWTPPLAVHHAFQLEQSQIQDRFGLRALVSITDHDNITGPLKLRVLSECERVPVSVEWTVPFRGTFVHFGVHNLPLESARDIMAELAAFTAIPAEERLGDLLEWLAACPERLVVFNHPCWDEKGISHNNHMVIARELLNRFGSNLHALELNGLRPWAENRDAILLARDYGKPVISGGDRHALEPNTILNLTKAGSFSEFADEVRNGRSTVLITNQYSEPFFLRILQTIEDTLAYHENHGEGWRRWDERVFYRCEDGIARSLATLWGGRGPLATRIFVNGVQMLRQPPLRQVFRATFAKREEVAL